MQDQLFRLMLATMDGRGDDAATAVIALGERIEGFDEAAARRFVADVVGRYHHARAERAERRAGAAGHGPRRQGVRPAAAVRTPTARQDTSEPARYRPRAGCRLRHQWLDAAQRHQPDAATDVETFTPGHLLSSALDARDFAERLPQRLNRVLDALAANDLRLKVEVIDHGAIIDGLQKVANRIALGVVLAALIVGAAMLMRVPTAFTILGYPGIAMILFLAAAAGAIWLAWTILASDVRRTRAK